MPPSCIGRICIDKRVARSICHSRATCILCNSAIRLTTDQIMNRRCLHCCGQCSSRSWTASILPSFDILLQSIGDLSRLVLLHILTELPSAFVKAKSELLTFARWCHFDKFKKIWINRCIQNKMALKCATNHRNWLKYFEDVSRKCWPSNLMAPLFWSTLYIRATCHPCCCKTKSQNYLLDGGRMC